MGSNNDQTYKIFDFERQNVPEVTMSVLLITLLS